LLTSLVTSVCPALQNGEVSLTFCCTVFHVYCSPCSASLEPYRMHVSSFFSLVARARKVLLLPPLFSRVRSFRFLQSLFADAATAHLSHLSVLPTSAAPQCRAVELNSVPGAGCCRGYSSTNKLAEAVTRLICVRQVHGLNLGRDTLF
jgi:hypothetical protein